jgi:hypothetical protein
MLPWDENSLDVAFLVDTTGTMDVCWNQVRRRAKQLVAEFQKEVPGSRLAVICFKDHGEEGENEDYLTLTLDFTDSPEEVRSFLLSRRVAPGRGGGGAEAVECALHRARDFPWRPWAKRAVVIVGDKPPHGGGLDGFDACPRGIDYRDEVERLRRERVKIFTVLVGDCLEARRVFEWMSATTGGISLELASPKDLCTLLVRACLRAAEGRFVDA